MTGTDYVYLWVDGIHLKVRLEQDKVCLLVMVGVRADGRKELVALTRRAATFILAHEMRGRDVTVNAIAPGPTATDMFLTGKTPEQLDSFAPAPLGRLGTPDDIAETVAFLAGPTGHWVNGQTLRANGGLT